MPSVSILNPGYNAEGWVADNIHSVLDQTHRDIEVTVVDDGSTDRCLQLIQSFCDRIQWATGPNRGGNVAENRIRTCSECVLPSFAWSGRPWTMRENLRLLGERPKYLASRSKPVDIVCAPEEIISAIQQN